MKSIPSLVLPSLAFLVLFPGLSLRASGEPGFSARLEPSRSRWVPRPTRLVLELSGLDPSGLAVMDLGSLRLTLDGLDVTGLFFRAAAATGGVKWEPAISTLTLSVPADLPPGRHAWVLSGRTRTGGRLRWWGKFTVYQPQRALSLAERIARAGGGPVIRVEDFDPPELELHPADRAFLHGNKPRLEVRWSDALTWVDLHSAKILLDGNDVTSSFNIRNWGAFYEVPSSSPLKDGKHVFVVQVKDVLGNLAVASSTFLVLDDSHRAPWPFYPTNRPHPLAHTHHQYQYYGGSPYFHHGIDIRVPAHSTIYAPMGGKVVSLYWYGRKPYYFEVGIRDANGFTWQFHHVDEPTVTQTIRDAYKKGTSIPAGTKVGNIVYWPVKAYGMYFHHTHMNVLDPDGRYVNPVHLILKSNDNLKPVIKDVLFTKNGSNRALNRPGGPRPVLSGAVDIVAQAEDREPNQPYQRTIYLMEWSVKGLGAAAGHDVPFTPLWRFDSLPGGSNRFAFVDTVFQLSIYYNGYTHRTCGNYTCHTFYYNVTNTINGVPDKAGAWDTAARDPWGRPLFPNGIYRVTLRATDDRGNSTTKSVDVEVRN